MNEIILVKYGEIILKGGNRPVFEKILIKNIKDALKNIEKLGGVFMSNDINIFTPFVNALVDVTKVTVDLFLQAFNVFCNNETMVIGPTPPGTGLM